MHVVEDGVSLVLSPWCPGEETLSGKLILLEETKRKQKWKEPGGKQAREQQRLLLRKDRDRLKEEINIQRQRILLREGMQLLHQHRKPRDSCLGFPFKESLLISWKYQ